LRAHLVQLDIAWEDRDANIAAVDRLLNDATIEPGDLVVLPELFDSGFSLNIEATSDADQVTADAVSRLAQRYKVTMHGSRTILGPDNKGRNQAHIVGPDGGVLVGYEKIHPFSFGREPERFTGGDSVTTYQWSAGTTSLRVCPAVCYDLRFPELFRAGLALGAQCFVLGANWPSERAAHWRALLIARAIENQAFVLGVNRAGSDPHLAYAGGSMAIGPMGDILLEMGEAEGVGSVTIDPGLVRAWREKFPAWKDGKPWLAGDHRVG
jgi:predicted amidohydrolase